MGCSESATKEYLDVNLAHWERYGFGLWVLRDPEGRFAGRGGIRHIAIESKDEIELAYSLMQELWGKGLATEIAAATVKLASEHFGLSELVALALVDNAPSRRVMEKLGFAYERDVPFLGFENALYRLHLSA